MRDNWRKECCRDLMVPCADMNTDILYRILFSTSDCITVCHIWLPVIRKNKWLRFQTVCRYIPLSLKNHNRLVIFVCQRIEWRYIFSTNTGHPLKNTCEMTGTDFSTDGLMRRYVTGGNNQWHTVASLHMKWSTKTGHRVRVFSSIDFPIRLVVTHHYIRAVLVRCNIQRYSPLLRELHRWSLHSPSPAPIRSSDSWRSAPLGCYPSSFHAGSYSAWSGIATVTAGTACSYNDCLDRCGTSPRRAYHGFPMPFPVLSW